jgi:hypothetical protein
MSLPCQLFYQIYPVRFPYRERDDSNVAKDSKTKDCSEQECSLLRAGPAWINDEAEAKIGKAALSPNDALQLAATAPPIHDFYIPLFLFLEEK